MQKYITKRNLMILNAVLAVVLALTGFFGIVFPLISAKPVDTSTPTNTAVNGTAKVPTARPDRTTYGIIATNDLFVFKGKLDEAKKPIKTAYDLPKAWELNGVFNAPDGPHALIRDKAEPDKESKQPFSTYEVKVGDIREGTQPPRIYNVEILEIAKDPEKNTWYVKCYRHDMVDNTEEERIFYLRAW